MTALFGVRPFAEREEGLRLKLKTNRVEAVMEIVRALDQLNRAEAQLKVEREKWDAALQGILSPEGAGEARRPRKRYARLTPGDVADMRRLRSEQGLSYIKLGERFGCSPQNAYCVCAGKTHQTIPESAAATEPAQSQEILKALAEKHAARIHPMIRRKQAVSP